MLSFFAIMFFSTSPSDYHPCHVEYSLVSLEIHKTTINTFSTPQKTNNQSVYGDLSHLQINILHKAKHDESFPLFNKIPPVLKEISCTLGPLSAVTI